jgi:prepilin-type N-terminal cleavage/methylation domain-containing protein
VQGTTLIEALVAISVIGVLAAIAGPNVTQMGSKPLPDTANRVAGVLRAARAKAIATTTPIKIKPKGRLVNPDGTSTGGSNYIFEIWTANSTNVACNSEVGWTQRRSSSGFSAEDLTFAQTKDTSGVSTPLVELQSTQVDNAVLAVPTGWEVCFNTRGMASITSTSTTDFQGNNIILTLQQVSDSKTQRVEIFPAGGIQIYEN